MHPARFVRTMVSLVMVGVGGFVLGCSGPPDAPPVDKETGKKIAADMKTAQKEAKAERKAKEGPKMKDMMRNRKSGGPE